MIIMERMDLRELQADYLRKQREVTEERIKIGALIRTILSENVKVSLIF